MSDSTPTPQPETAWSSFATFEMPTTDIVLELPPIGAVDLDQPVAAATEAVAEPEAEVAEVEVAEAEVAEAEVAEAEVTEAEVTEAEVTEAEVTEVEVAEVKVAEVEVAEVEVAEVEVAEAEVAPTADETFIDVRGGSVPEADDDIPDVEDAFADVLKPPAPLAKKPGPEVKAVQKSEQKVETQKTVSTEKVTAASVIDRIREKQQAGNGDHTAAVESPAPAPVTVAPVTVAPVTVAPVTVPPVTAAPVTVAPVTVPPVTVAPVTVAPVTAAPVAAAPDTSAAVTATSIAAAAAVSAPVASSAVTATSLAAAAVAAASVTTAPVKAAPVQAALPVKPAAPVTPVAPAADQQDSVVVEAGAAGQVMFRDLPLREEVQRSIERSGYDKPTEIQAQIIPYMLDGRDVLAQSQTGTGKTAAFALPILSRIDIDNHSPQVLVLAPTRELAIQVGRSFATYASDIPGFSVATIYGGADYDTQLRALRNGAQVVVGTPGRTIDHINRGTLKLGGITCLALDEADEMLNMGFLEDVEYVLERTPDDRQIALFSATMPAPIRKIAQKYLNDPARITVKSKTMTADSIRQRALIVYPRDKVDTLIRFLEVEQADGVIVFTKTREATVTVAEALCQHGLSAVALNGDIPQKLRERTIEQLKSGKLDILVATDVAARGLDVQRISHVFNYDVPNDSESYVHRIGRTGRAGRKGEAIIFLSNSERYKLRSIERVTKQPIEVVEAPTADDMNAMRVVRFKEKITEVMTSQDLGMFHKMITEYAEESGKPVPYIAAALAHIGQNGRPFFVEDRPRRKPPQRDDRRPGNDRGDRRPDRGRGRGGSEERFGGAPRQLSAPRTGMERFRIEVGSKDGVKPGNIVGAVANEGGLDGDQIGPISIHPTHSTVDLPSGMPVDIYQKLQQTWVAGKQLQLTRDNGQSSSAPSAGGGGAHRSGGGSRPSHGGARKSFPPRSGGSGGAGAAGSKFKKRKPRPRD